MTIGGDDVVHELATLEPLNSLPLRSLVIANDRIMFVVPHVVRPDRPAPLPSLPLPGIHTLDVATDYAQVKFDVALARWRLYALKPGLRVLDEEDFMLRSRAASRSGESLINPSLITAAALWSEPRVVASVELSDFSDNGFHARLTENSSGALDAVRARAFPRSFVAKTDSGVDVSFGSARNPEGLAMIADLLPADDARVVIGRSDATTRIDDAVIEHATRLDPGVRLLLAYELAADLPSSTSDGACRERHRAVTKLLGSIRTAFAHFADEVDGLADFNEERCVAGLHA